MKLAGKIQVEPLEDDRWVNIERAVVTGAADAASKATVRSSRWGLALAFGAAMLVVVVAAGLIGWKARGPGGSTMLVESPPLRIDTSERSSEIDIGDATITSDPSTVFVVTRPANGVLLTMERGRVELDVDKRGSRAPLVVRAGDTDVVVVGTRFSVDFGDGTRGAIVHVTEGVVKVVRASKEARVAANQGWTMEVGVVEASRLAAIVAANRPATAAAAGPATDTVAMADGSTTTDPATGSAGDPAATGSAGYDIQTGDGPDVLRDRQVVVPEARLSTNGAGSGSASTKPKTPTGGPELRTRPGQTSSSTADPNVDLKTLIKRQPVAPPLDVGPKNPAEAVAAYRTIFTAEKGERAAHAFYSIAHVQHFKLQRHSDALSTLDGYFRRFEGFSKTKEYSAALWLRVRILCLQNIDDRCRQAAYTFVQKTDNAEVRRVAETIVIQR